MREETCPHCGKRGGRELWTGFDSYQRELGLGRMSYDWTEIPAGFNPSVLCGAGTRGTIGKMVNHEFSVCRNCGEATT